MENHWDKCILLWGNGQFRKSIPHHPSTNTPIFHSAPSSKAYHAFAATFEACDAFYRNEHVLQVPGLGKHHDPDEFIANENINLRHANYPDAAKVREDDETIKTSNRSEHSPPPSYEPSEQSERRGPLTFDPSPPDMEEDDPSLAAADDQAELMRWHSSVMLPSLL